MNQFQLFVHHPSRIVDGAYGRISMVLTEEEWCNQTFAGGGGVLKGFDKQLSNWRFSIDLVYQMSINFFWEGNKRVCY